jgi:ribosomal protein S8
MKTAFDSKTENEGVMTGTQAKKKNLGGELLCYIW